MKYNETNFIDYINTCDNYNLHPKLDKIYNKFTNNLSDLSNLIIYGPKGVGKYTQMLKIISRYSPSKLKYNKKLNIISNKISYTFKISDIHFEIDMELLGCNSKLLWHDFYTQIIDIFSIKNLKCGIIVCYNFHEINNELLEIFYSYMQQNIININIKFILISQSIGFINNNILNCCETIHVTRPSKNSYTKCCSNNKLLSKFKLSDITNIKNLSSNIKNLNNPHKFICDDIIAYITNKNKIKFNKLREYIYNILTYNLNIYDCVWYILQCLLNNKCIPDNKISETFIKTYLFFIYYNNNYRPIYHIENYIIYLISVIPNK
jgi:hypothetical protein